MFSLLPIAYNSNQSIQSILNKIKPTYVLKIYENFYADRKILYKDFKNDTDSYVYIVVNKLNGKFYVGSSRSLKVRVSNYFNLSHLASQKNRPISSAILKYGLVNFAFIVVEKVDISLYNIEVRETYWIRDLKPDYNATKDAARNIGASHTIETKLEISRKRSSGSIFIYNEYKQLLTIAPSMISIAILLGNKSISISINRAIKDASLFRSSGYLSKVPFNIDDKPLIEAGSQTYTQLIDQMKTQKHMKAIFVFKDETFIAKCDGIMIAAKTLAISHNTIKECILNNTTYKEYRFSYHRV